MKCKGSILSFLLIILLSSFILIDCLAVTIEPETYFILDTYSTYINFEDTEEFTEIVVESTYVTFDDYRLVVITGNVTFINWFNDDTLKFTTSWNSGGTTQIYMNGTSPITIPFDITYTGQPITQSWIDSNNTLKLLTPNPNTIEIFWTGEEPPTVTLAIVKPQNTTYTSSSIPVTLTASGGTIHKIWYNCKNETQWIYASNKTYTSSTSMTGFQNGTYHFYAWANNTDGNSDEADVWFTVAIPPPPPPPSTPGTVNLYFPSSNSIGFQSLGDKDWMPIDAWVTVSSGTLQGSNVVLSVSTSGGSLKFTSLSTATLIPYNVTIIGGTTSKGITTVKSGDIVIFRWRATSVMLIGVFWAFSNMTMWLGLAGLGMILFGSVLTVKFAEDREWRPCLIFMFIIIPIGFALLVGWIFA